MDGGTRVARILLESRIGEMHACDLASLAADVRRLRDKEPRPVLQAPYTANVFISNPDLYTKYTRYTKYMKYKLRKVDI